jgi:large subunit ribosomal protein L16
MLLKPNGRRYAKAHKGRLSYTIRTNQSLVYGDYGLVAMEPARLTAAQISAAFVSIKRIIKKQADVYLRVFPHIPVTGKPAEVRMGKGKGSVEYYMCRIRRGAVIFEIKSSIKNLAILSLRTASYKLPFKTITVTKSSSTTN